MKPALQISYSTLQMIWLFWLTEINSKDCHLHVHRIHISSFFLTHTKNVGTLSTRVLTQKYYNWFCQYCPAPLTTPRSRVLPDSSEWWSLLLSLHKTALRCGSSSCFKTPCSSWRVIRSQSRDSCMLTAAPPIKTGDLSGPCVCPVGELWPRKYASDTFAAPVIESQPICPVMHMILKAQRCAFGRYSSLNHQGSQQQHMSHDFVLSPLLMQSDLTAPHYLWSLTSLKNPAINVFLSLLAIY